MLNILAALDTPTAGSVQLDGRELGEIKEGDVAAFRRDNLGFVFQDFNLLDTFTVEDNIFLPLVLAGKSYKEMNERLRAVASRLMITDLLKKYPYEISGGQKQRILVARALVASPRLLLLDEPFTGLDHPNQDALSRLFVDLARCGVGILMSTHDLGQAVDICHRLVMLNGTVRAEGEPCELSSPEPWMETFRVSQDSALLRSLGMVRR